MTNECFYCGKYYTFADARDVPIDYSGTYCSEYCMNLDQAQIKADVLAECKEADALREEQVASITTIAGFNLKIKKDNENG